MRQVSRLNVYRARAACLSSTACLPVAVCLLVAALQSGCGGSSGQRDPDVPGVTHADDDDGAEVEAGAQSADSEALAGSSLLVDGRRPDPRRALPRLSTRHIGMHIGGGDNSSEAKRPWLEAIGRGELDFLRCYRLVNQPLHGGTFGVDLHVPAGQRKGEVRDMRHKLGGERFAGCMKEAFEDLRFPKPPRATVLSYSLRFDVD